MQVNPKAFKIVNGKLYLCYNFYFTNTIKAWNKDEQALIIKEDRNWDKLFAQ